jgi:hypothetical protein
MFALRLWSLTLSHAKRAAEQFAASTHVDNLADRVKLLLIMRLRQIRRTTAAE